jgi:hypothetical protein
LLDIVVITPAANYSPSYKAAGFSRRRRVTMWKRNWWRETGRGRTSDYSGTVKMAIGALVIVVLVIVLLQLLRLT